ncbi:hypothetical protein ABT56_16780 [Photobacterium aquae]|uniref:HPt domain-containing protein n=1 Tax=Photobacterium aquae TaxID=1195763 RepID=A0A0J1GW29_9GAMM|nr:Hpt domain-containing protein [Photobacterium aquae]KLV03890.1 hypothetical protein ABT56_16780 [Photobacterium aquae]
MGGSSQFSGQDDKDRASYISRRKAVIALCIGCVLLVLAVVLPVTPGYAIAVVGGMALVAAMGFYYQSRDVVQGPDPEMLSRHGEEVDVSGGDDPSEQSEQSEVCASVEAKPPVFAPSHLLDSMDGDRDSAAMLLEIFLDEHSDDGEVLLRLADNEEWSGVEKTLHTLKGVAGSIGADALHVHIVAVEGDLLSHGRLERESLLRLNQEITVLEVAINEALAGLRAVSPERQATVVSQAETESGQYGQEGAGNLAATARPAEVVDSRPSIDKALPMDGVNAAIDISVMLNALDDDAEMVQMLLGVFVEEHQHDGKVFVEMVSSGCIDEQTLRLVHSLKGVAANLGANTLQEIATALEMRLKQQQPVPLDDAHRLAIVLEQTVESARYYLHSWGVNA